MPGWELTGAAEQDIADIAQYSVEQFGIEQAIAYRDGLLETFAFLAEYPRAARVRPELRGEIRIHPYRSHLIVYRIAGDRVRILRIRHAREDWLDPAMPM